MLITKHTDELWGRACGAFPPPPHNMVGGRIYMPRDEKHGGMRRRDDGYCAEIYLISTAPERSETDRGTTRSRIHERTIFVEASGHNLESSQT